MLLVRSRWLDWSKGSPHESYKFNHPYLTRNAKACGLLQDDGHRTHPHHSAAITRAARGPGTTRSLSVLTPASHFAHDQSQDGPTSESYYQLACDGPIANASHGWDQG